MPESLLLEIFNEISKSYMENDRALLKLCTALIEKVEDLQHEQKIMRQQVDLLLDIQRENQQ